MYIGKQQGPLWELYYQASEIHQQFAYFYATSLEVGSKHFLVDTNPVVIVYKENTHYNFPHSDVYNEIEMTTLNDSIHNWIIQEKFLTFPKISRENLHQLRQTKKYLVIAVVEENKLQELETHEQEFKDMIEAIIRTKRSKYHNKFQFAWTGQPDLAHSILMDNVPTPHLLVLNSSTYHHHIPDDDPLAMTPEVKFNNLIEILENNYFFFRLLKSF